MKLFYRGMLFGAMALGLVACSDDNPWSAGADGEGGLRLLLSTSADVSDAVPVLRSTETLVAPAVESFGIRLEKNDGSYSREWGSINDFNAENFKVGTYTLTAFNGDINSEGFDLPCFEGKTEVTVLEARTTDVSVTATLANTMVSINYTDAFKSYFKGYAATLHSEGHSYVAYPADREGVPAYLAPGYVDIAVQVTDSKDRTVTVQPAKFDAVARHHYHVTIDVKGGSGTGAVDQLVVSFDDSVDQEAVTIDLTDELFTSKAPEIAPNGFTDGQVIEYLQGDKAPSEVQFDIIAMGGLESVMLTVNSATYIPSFGKEFDLMSADPQTQSILESAGVVAKGLWNNPDRMAFVNLTSFCRSLPAGRHEITLVAKDKFTRMSDPVTVVFDTNAVDITVTPKASVFGTGQAMMDVAYNGNDFTTAFAFQAQDDYGNWQDCHIASAARLAPTRALPVITYSVTISLPESRRKEIPVRVFYRGSQVEEMRIPVVTPEFEASYDAYASSLAVKVVPTDAAMMDVVAKSVSLYLDGARVDDSNVVRDANNGILILNGLTPSKEYRIAASLLDPEDSDWVTITTETPAQVPNGDFEQLTVTYDKVKMNQGGRYQNTRLTPLSYNTQVFTISEPDGWVSNNSTTCNLASDPMNSWFVSPAVFNSSVYWESTTHQFSPGLGGKTGTSPAHHPSAQNGDNAMVIRNVGWSANGTLPADQKGTKSGNDSYYSTNKPSSFNRSAGTLYLGSSSSEGAAFSSRPAALSGYYSYTRDSQDGAEVGVASVQVLSGSTVIATATLRLDATDGYQQFNIPLSYDKAAFFGKKATSVRIRFTSSDRQEPVVTSYAELHRQEATGAVLLVDNLSFEY